MSKLTVRAIQVATARQFNVTLGELIGPKRHKVIVKHRHLAMWIARQLTEASFPELARAFGRRDHTTVLYACRKMDGVMASDEQMRDVAEKIVMVASAHTPLGRGQSPVGQLRDMLPDGEMRRCRAIDAEAHPGLVQSSLGSAPCQATKTSADVKPRLLGTGSS